MLKKLLVCAGVFVWCATAQAHFIFLQFENGKVSMRLAEGPADASGKDLQEKIAPVQVKTAKGDVLTMVSGQEALWADAGPDVNVVTASFEYGVLDRSAQGRGVFMLLYHAKAAKTAAEAATKAGLPVEVVAEVKDGTLHIEVLNDGKPAPAAELTIAQEGYAEVIEEDTDAQGKATVPVSSEGWIAIRAMVPQEKSGESNGTGFTAVRHYSTLVFPSPAVKAEAAK